MPKNVNTIYDPQPYKKAMKYEFNKTRYFTWMVSCTSVTIGMS